ncbi:MAG: SDR family oxidoreductase [Magnetovibrio sp.]|nr:SDR family oxidoreductase [Magnetovibrio sp.]
MSAAVPVLLVTGASRGIGAATARLGAERGYAVAVNYRASQAEADAVVAGIAAAGGTARAFQADVSQWPEAERLFADVEAAFGPVTALVNNVGGTGGVGPFAENGPEKLESVFALNTFSAFYGIRLAADHMARAGGGAIVNVTSQAATFGGVNISAYAAAKAAVSTMTLSASRELAGQGIRVNAVSPGVIEAGEFLDFPAERRDAMLANLPLGRFGEPEEVAEAIIWLLSDAAAYVTGAVLPVCGGR